jgi:eukaryotic-like serine/threonine-protein kinase
MRAEDWKTIKAVLNETLKLATSDRRLYLNKANLTAEVRAEVESLLNLEPEAEDFMSLTASGFARALFDGSESSADSLINQKIGIYEIVSELGLGGMGAVYLARRRDAGLANAVLMVYPETGHALHWERPSEFVNDLEEFITRTEQQ